MGVLVMSPLKFEFDETNELCIWKGDDEPIAFVLSDLDKLMQCIYSLLNKECQNITFHRTKYYPIKLEIQDENFHMHGKNGYYIIDDTDLKRLLAYLSENIAKMKSL